MAIEIASRWKGRNSRRALLTYYSNKLTFVYENITGRAAEKNEKENVWLNIYRIAKPYKRKTAAGIFSKSCSNHSTIS